MSSSFAPNTLELNHQYAINISLTLTHSRFVSLELNPELACDRIKRHFKRDHRDGSVDPKPGMEIPTPGITARSTLIR